MDERTCSKCGETKALGDFRKRRNVCKLCVMARAKQWRLENRERLLPVEKSRSREWRKSHPDLEGQKARRYHLKRAFGLTEADVEAMRAEQGNRCAICGSAQATSTGVDFAVDHDHATGRVRGLLCFNCNQGLGRFHDDEELLEKAASYLRARRGIVHVIAA